MSSSFPEVRQRRPPPGDLQRVENFAEKETDSVTSRVCQLANATLKRKRDEYDKKTPRNLDDGIMIGGDIFTMGYMAFEGLKAAIPSLQCMTTACISAGFGIIAGVINIGVATICIKNGIQALINKDYKTGFVQLAMGILAIFLGALMILISIAPFIAGLSGITIFLAANPWVLPLLFLTITLILLVDISRRILKILIGVDIGSKLKLKKVKQILSNANTTTEKTNNIAGKIFGLYKDNKKTWTTPQDGGVFNVDKYEKILREGPSEKEEEYEALREYCIQILQKRKKEKKITEDEQKNLNQLLKNKKYTTENLAKLQEIKEKIIPLTQEGSVKEIVLAYKLSGKMEELQSEVGVEAGLLVFELFVKLLKLKIDENSSSQIGNEKSLNRIQQLVGKEGKKGEIEKEITKWNMILYLRLFQQILYIASLPISCLAACSRILNAIQNFFLSLANLIPLFLDSFARFKRNAPVVVPRVEIGSVLNSEGNVSQKLKRK